MLISLSYSSHSKSKNSKMNPSYSKCTSLSLNDKTFKPSVLKRPFSKDKRFIFVSGKKDNSQYLKMILKIENAFTRLPLFISKIHLRGIESINFTTIKIFKARS